MQNRDTVYPLLFADGIKKHSSDDFKYFFIFEERKYDFSIFSDCRLQESDRIILESSDRERASLPRTLKLASSIDLINPRVAIGNSLTGVLKPLILFEDKGIDKVIDYSKNIIMTKEDYYSIFDFKELNVVDKFDLYNIYFMIDSFRDYEHIYEYIFFFNEIFQGLAKNQFSTTKRYNRNGINSRNCVIWGNNHDCLFLGKRILIMLNIVI